MSKNTTTLETLIVLKDSILTTPDYNLSASRYKVQADYTNAKWPMVELGEVCEIKTGKKDVNSGNRDGIYPFFTCAKECTYSDEYSFDDEALLIAGNGVVGDVKYYKGKFEAYQRTYILTSFKEVLPHYLFFLLKTQLPEYLQANKLGNTMPYIKLGMLTDFKIPLPPLSVQEEIVREIDGYQKIIDGAKQVIENWKPRIDIDPTWEKVKLGEVCEIKKGSFSSTKTAIGEYPLVLTSPVRKTANSFDFECESVLIPLISATGHGKADLRNVHYQNGKFAASNLLAVLITKTNKLNMKFLREYLFQEKDTIAKKYMNGAANVSMKKEQLFNFEIYLAPTKFQDIYINRKEEEEKLVEANKKLVEIYEEKVKNVIQKIWG